MDKKWYRWNPTTDMSDVTFICDDGDKQTLFRSDGTLIDVLDGPKWNTHNKFWWAELENEPVMVRQARESAKLAADPSWPKIYVAIRSSGPLHVSDIRWCISDNACAWMFYCGRWIDSVTAVGRVYAEKPRFFRRIGLEEAREIARKAEVKLPDEIWPKVYASFDNFKLAGLRWFSASRTNALRYVNNAWSDNGVSLYAEDCTRVSNCYTPITLDRARQIAGAEGVWLPGEDPNPTPSANTVPEIKCLTGWAADAQTCKNCAKHYEHVKALVKNVGLSAFLEPDD